MADDEELQQQRDREMSTPDTVGDDQNQFDEAFGPAVKGEAPEQDTQDSDDSSGEDAGSDQETQGDEQDNSETQSSEETWDQIGRELGALFESDEAQITPDRVKHHVKTWHGRYKSERDKRRQAEQELEKLKAGGEQSNNASQSESASQDTASAESIEELQRRFSNEYGEDLPQFVEQIARARAREIAQEQATQAVQPLQERQQQVDSQEHYRRVTETHPDAEQLAGSDDLWQWIDSQPDSYRDFYNSVAENGSADDVIRMLSDFKAANGVGGSSNPQDSSQDDQSTSEQGGHQPARRAPQRPPSRSPSGPRRGEADPNDFDSAFDEALRA